MSRARFCSGAAAPWMDARFGRLAATSLRGSAVCQMATSTGPVSRRLPFSTCRAGEWQGAWAGPPPGAPGAATRDGGPDRWLARVFKRETG